jgi:hypothetical protein
MECRNPVPQNRHSPDFGELDAATGQPNGANEADLDVA